LSTFISLIGANQLNLAVVMDASTKESQAVKKLTDAGRLKKGGLIQISEFTGSGDADMFAVSFYVELVNRAYANDLSQKLTVKELPTGDRVVKRIDGKLAQLGVIGGRLNHYRPSAVLLREQATLLPKIDDATVQRFQALFDRINARLS
jgi:hypothetical protein